MKTVKIPLSNIDSVERYCFTERGEKYYLAYETEPNKPKSVMWANLDFIKKHFTNEKGNVTKDSLNDGRKRQIRDYELCLKFNCVVSELEKVDGETGELKTYVNGKGETVTHQIRYRLYGETISNGQRNASFSSKDNHYFNREIAKGLFILCEIVDDTPNYDI
jgi:hypothetical protein